MKTGLVLEGGAMRGIFTAGVLDYLMQKDVFFDYVVGVSAGANNGINFVSRQEGRCKKVITHENVESYYGFKQFLKSHTTSNMEKMIKEYALNEFPFDFDTFFSSKTEFENVVINCETGLPEYHGNFKNQEEFFNYNIATCSLPFFTNPVKINENHYLDGSLTDSIPLKRAVEKGCEKIIIILTKPDGGAPTDYKKMKPFINIVYHKYPKLCEAMCKRVENYKIQTEYIQEMVSLGKAMIIRPEVQYVRHIDSNKEHLNNCYQHGKDIADKHFDEIKTFLALQ